MGKVKTPSSISEPKAMRPGLTPESEENLCISLATDLAKKQLLEGTASSQVITHFLKLGTTLARLEKEKLELENENLKAKTEALKSQQHSEELMEKAINAFRTYSGQGDQDDY